MLTRLFTRPARPSRFAWRPAVDLTNPRVLASLIAMYGFHS